MIQGYLDQGDLNAARGALDRLGSIRDQLPEALQQEVDRLRGQLRQRAEAGQPR